MLSLLLVVGSLLVAQANDSAKPDTANPDAAKVDLATEVRRLVRELNAPEVVRRDAAQQKLLELGPAVLDLLPAPTDRSSAEEKQRLGQIRDKLQRAQAESTVKATYVTLHGEMPLSQVFAAIEKQTGNAMIDHREQFGQQAGDPKLKVSFDKVPFWQAVDELLDQAGLTVYAYPEKDGVAVISRPDEEIPRRSRPVSYTGAFRLEAVDLLARRGLKSATDRRLQLQMELSWEPRLDPITIQYQLADIQAVDDAGNTLELQMGEAVQESSINPGELSTEMIIPFVAPERGVKSIASLKGKLLALVPGSTETFRFPDLSKRNLEQRKAGVAVVLDQVRKNGDVWEVRVLVRFDKASGALESHRGWVFGNEAYLETPDKQRIDFDGFETTRQTESEVGVAYVCDLDSPKGMTLVYKTPSVVTVLPVEYEIKDLKLP